MENYGILDRVKIPKRIQAGFLSGVAAGLLTHFYMFTHKLPNWDDINNFVGYGAGRNVGRWFLHFTLKWGSEWSLPAVHGVLAVFLLAIAACLISENLGFKRKSSVCLISIAVVTFPSVAGTMTFMFVVHTYALAVVMMCLGTYLIHKYRYGFLPGSILLIVAMGIYQPYISFAISLMLGGMLSDILRRAKEGKKIFLDGIKNVIILLVSVAVYMLLCRLYYPGISEETYGGVGQMGQIAIAEVPRLIGRCYKRFLEYFIWKPFTYVSPVMRFANIIVCICIGILFIYNLYCIKRNKDKIAFFLGIMTAGLLPLAMAFVYFMAPEAPFSILMTYAYVLVYAVAVLLLEIAADNWQGRGTDKKVVRLFRKAAVAIVFFSVLLESYTSYLVTNEAYYRMSVAYERTAAFFNRILVRLEQEEGFAYGDKIVILGEFYYVDNPSPIEINDLENDRFREMSGIALENGMITSGVRDNFIRMYLGFELPSVSEAEKEEIMQSLQYKEMSCYPDVGAIQKINGIWVIKLCD